MASSNGVAFSSAAMSTQEGPSRNSEEPEKMFSELKREVTVTENDADSFSDVENGVEARDIDVKKRQVFKGWTLFWLAYQSTGVIYGDIGTSPLYVYSSTFSSNPTRDDLLGALSLIIWTLTLIVTVKYVFIVLRADDEGEGGTFAIYSLLSRYMNINKVDPKAHAGPRLERARTNDLRRTTRNVRWILENSKLAHGFLRTISVFGVSLIMADGVLTPAQSVLGAIQGLEVVSPNMSEGTIIGVSCAILVLLFVFQPLGISKLGSIFAPVVVVWLTFNLSFGIYNLAMHDASVLKAFSPYYAGLYFVRNKTDGWRSLGGILLAFTGVEALFADLGAFSRRAVQLSWICFAYPCLLLAYIGQAAFISDDPSAYSNPFFKTVPPGMFWPSLIVSILAAIVASQAIITGSFQLLSQVMNMSYFPQIKMIYTSKKFHGQVYIPLANWLLMVGTVIVTAVYSNTTRLGNAYGVCVILVTFITTNLVALVAVTIWQLPSVLVFVIWLPFVTLDGLYLSSALTKVPDGAWFTLLLAVILASIFILWRFGKEEQWKAEAAQLVPMSRLMVKDKNGDVRRMHKSFGGGEIINMKGMGIFFDKAGAAVPTVYAQFLQKFEAQPKVQVFLHIKAISRPVVEEEDKYTVSNVANVRNSYRVVIRHGYAEQPVTSELGHIVYEQIRRHIVQGSFDTKTAVMTTAVDLGTVNPKLPREALTDNLTASSSTDNITPAGEGSSTPANFQGSDHAKAMALSALDSAYAVQTVYIVGKEQMRCMEPAKRGISEWIGPKAFRRLVLELFLFIRENSATRAKNMKINTAKLVEVGFVLEIP